MPEHKIHVLYHGLRLQQPSAGVRELEGRLKILTVGRWSEKKGLSELVEALALARDRGVDFSLTLIAGGGSPDTKGEYDARLQTWGWIPERLFCRGFRTGK